MAKPKAKGTKVKAAPAKKAMRAKAVAAEPVVTAAAKPERIVQNGIRRPLPDSACGSVWSWLDDCTENEIVVTAADVKTKATAEGWNQNNASIEFYQWKRFMGITKPRVIPKAKRKSVAKTAAAVITEAAPAEHAS